MKILTCVGTRPNFIKITRLSECFEKYNSVDYKLLHTGQHYDANMSDVFFNELGINKPDYYLDAQGDSQVTLIADIMVKIESIFKKWKPDWVIVPGDVNSSVACAFAASRNGIKVAHLESGLRSFDRTMPEEINRIIIDDLSDLFFITEPSGTKNLLAENKNADLLKFVGNTMIDSLVKFMPKIDASTILKDLNVYGEYAVLTFHRPGNVDNIRSLKKLVGLLSKIASKIKLIFPIHPRTKNNLEKHGLSEVLKHPNIVIAKPLGYLDFLHLLKYSQFILTDSGGIQEESTFLQVPCITIRPNTERPITIDIGSNQLMDLDEDKIFQAISKILSNRYQKSQIPQLWDGRASERIVDILMDTAQ